MNYFYYINLNERGDFYADVRDEQDNTIFEIQGHGIFEDGYMDHSEDLIGLKDHLNDLGIMTSSDILWIGE